MARALNTIQQSILTKWQASNDLAALQVLTPQEQQALPGLTSTSKVARWRLFAYVVAFSIWVFESILDVFKSDVNTLLEAQRIHNFQWYKDKALAFRYGQNLVSEKDYYSDAGLTVEQISASKIIKHCAVIRVIQNGRGTLQMKVAKDVNGDLSELDANELAAFAHYMFRVGDAGTLIIPKTRPADDFKLTIDIHYNPLVLTDQGVRKDGTNNTPVVSAIKAFLYNLEFNGEFIKTKLVDYLQLVDGVVIPDVESIHAKYGALPYAEINETYIADAGYMRLDEANTTINYIARPNQ